MKTNTIIIDDNNYRILQSTSEYFCIIPDEKLLNNLKINTEKIIKFTDNSGEVYEKAKCFQIFPEMIKLKRIQRIQTIQKRLNYRAETEIEGRINKIFLKNDSLVELSKNAFIIIKNISTGGMYCESNLEFPVGLKFVADFSLDDNKIDNLCTEILRKNNSSYGTYNYGCKFNNVDFLQEKLITNYVFKRQLKSKKKSAI